MKNEQSFEEIIKYEFKNKSLLRCALTHTSYSNEHEAQGVKSNERLEFLGDSILGVVVSVYIFKHRIDLPEGDLSKIRSEIVCEDSLKKVADKIKVSDYIFLGKGEERNGGRRRKSILADVIEAIIAAIFLDSGVDKASEFIFNFMGDIISHATGNEEDKDYKTRLQEEVQKTPGAKIVYEVISETGPDHMKEFEIALKINNKIVSTAKGGSKKKAEKEAARLALVDINKKKHKKK